MLALKRGSETLVQSDEIVWDEEQRGWRIGDVIYADGGRTFHVETVIPPVTAITRLQLTLGMVGAGLITSDEGEAMANRTAIPAAIVAAINALPAGQRPAARIIFNSMTVVERSSLLLAIVMAQATPPISDETMDAYFAAWDQIQ